jgi:predicted dehydrogenase
MSLITRTFALLLMAVAFSTGAEKPLRLAIAGLVHGHVDGFLHAMNGRKDVQIVGIFDPDASLAERYAGQFTLGRSLFFTDLAEMLSRVKPEAVASFTSTYDHPAVVEACAERHIDVMMEKPLAVSMEHARIIQNAAARSGIHVIVNYETTWYPSHGEMWKLLKQRHAAGEIRKMVAMDGHEGPKEIHVQPEFFAWLTDPVKNGAGALFDFGCYGANLMTWMMENQKPLSVTAAAQQIKPQIYGKVDDQATILVEYPKAQGIIQASWNWPFNRKDFEVYGEGGYAVATGGSVLHARLPGHQEEALQPGPLPTDERDSISYLISVVRGRRKPEGLSSLENNMIVTEILDAARESAQTGKKILLVENLNLANTLTPEEQQAGWKLLFDGKTMDGWDDPRLKSPAGDAWTIEDGCLKARAHPQITEDLFTKETFRDFELAFDWRISHRGNSGVKYRIQEHLFLAPAARLKFEARVERSFLDRVTERPDKGQDYVIGFEYQVIDDDLNQDARSGLKHTAGALYDMVAPSAKVTKDVGEFNHSRIAVRGNHVEHWMNGIKVVDSALDSSDAIEGMKSRWGIAPHVYDLLATQPKKDCPISLQNHGDQAWFRNIKIHKLER